MSLRAGWWATSRKRSRMSLSSTLRSVSADPYCSAGVVKSSRAVRSQSRQPFVSADIS